MKPWSAALMFIFAVCMFAGVKTKLYVKDSGRCAHTYYVERGRILTRKGLVEDPHVTDLVRHAIGNQMNARDIRESAATPDLIFRFMGGNSTGLQIDDPTVGNVMVWDLGGNFSSSSHTYKKTTLFVVAVDGRTQQTIWSASCSDKFGDPKRVEERIKKAVEGAFKKFPKFISCSH
jgi:hypothetical protein